MSYKNTTSRKESKFSLHKRDGFTAIELLVVIAIIGVLVAIAFAGLNTSREKARDDVRISQMEEIALALEQYKDVCRQYPKKLKLNQNVGCSGSTTLGDFLNELPSPPQNPNVQNQRFRYFPVSLSNNSNNNRCIGYHLGIKLETNHSELNGDADLNTNNNPSNISPCNSNNQSGFNGNDSSSNMFDMAQNLTRIGY